MQAVPMTYETSDLVAVGCVLIQITDVATVTFNPLAKPQRDIVNHVASGFAFANGYVKQRRHRRRFSLSTSD